MKDPRRLYELSDEPFGRLLLEAGRSDEPPREWLARGLAGLGGAGTTAATQAAAAGVGAGGATLGSTSVTVVVKWLGLGALCGLGVSGAYTLAESRSARSARVDAVTASTVSPVPEPARIEAAPRMAQAP